MVGDETEMNERGLVVMSSSGLNSKFYGNPLYTFKQGALMICYVQ